MHIHSRLAHRVLEDSVHNHTHHTLSSHNADYVGHDNLSSIDLKCWRSEQDKDLLSEIKKWDTMYHNKDVCTNKLIYLKGTYCSYRV